MYLLSIFLIYCFFFTKDAFGGKTWPRKTDGIVTLTLDDMKFTPAQQATLKLKNAYIRTQKWPNGIIPYQMDSAIASDYSRKAAIEEGLRIYEEKTCIKWVPRTTEINYVEFMDGGAKQCFSMVGMLNEGKQDISIGKGCEGSIAVIVHEMMHAAGFMHEHMRPDRDNYITIVNSKIIPAMLNQFAKVYPSEVDQQNLAYDYYSVMHYPPNAFSVDGSDTIITKDPNAQGVIGQRTGFSKCDLEKLNSWYGCIAKITNDPSCKMNEESGEETTLPWIVTFPTATPPSLPTFQPPTYPPPVTQCTDKNPFTCTMFSYNCLVYPGYYLNECRQTCGNCDGKKCVDTNMFWYQSMCKSVKRNSCLYYMQKILCPKSCGLC